MGLLLASKNPFAELGRSSAGRADARRAAIRRYPEGKRRSRSLSRMNHLPSVPTSYTVLPRFSQEKSP